jgi:hypothetical protein
MGRRLDIEADDVLELGRELGIVRWLEAADAARRQAVRLQMRYTDGTLMLAASTRAAPSSGSPRAAARRRAGSRPGQMTSWPSGATREGALSRGSPTDPFLGEAFLPASDAG